MLTHQQMVRKMLDDPAVKAEYDAQAGEEEEDREESLDYVSALLRKSQTVLVRFRQGGRLQPLPYSLDDEDVRRPPHGLLATMAL